MGAQYQQLLDLAMDRAIDGKGGLAASIAETCLDPNSNLGEKELSLAFDIVRILIDKVELDIRRNIAEYLAERDDVRQTSSDSSRTTKSWSPTPYSCTAACCGTTS